MTAATVVFDSTGSLSFVVAGLLALVPGSTRVVRLAVFVAGVSGGSFARKSIYRYYSSYSKKCVLSHLSSES